MHAQSIATSRRAFDLRLKNLGLAVLCGLTLGLGGPALAQSIDGRVSAMSVEQKVGQIMIWSLTGTELTPATRATLTKYQPGAVIFFRHNIKTLAQVARFNHDLRRTAQTTMAAPMFSMVDQEGGLVTRIRTATPLPSALALADMDDPKFVRSFAAHSAEVLKEIGFNVNLAPVLDVSNPARESFIGNRTFGNDPARVAAMSDAFALGLADAGLMPTAKHFPGHGDTVQNSHLELPSRPVTPEQMRARDLVPFGEYANTTAPRAVMMAHLALPKVDPSGLPATFSSLMIQKYLRGDLGYRGLVITDDLEMNGAGISPDPGERAVRAFLAGNDMLMFAGTLKHQTRAYDEVLKAVRDGRITTARLDESVTRILAAKSKLSGAPSFDVRRVETALKKLDALSMRVLKSNFATANAHARHGWPSYQKARTVSVLTGSPMFYRKFRAAYPGAVQFKWLTRQNLAQTAAAMTKADEFAVYFASGQVSARWVNALPRALKAKFIVINCNEPAEVGDQDAYLGVFNVNSYFTDGGTWLAELLRDVPEVRVPAGQR